MIPPGQSRQTETASSCYSSLFGPSPFALISFFLPPAHICFWHLHSCWKLLSISLFNTLPYQSSTGLIWSLHNSSSSVSWPVQRPCQTNSIIKVKSELELWTVGFYRQGNLPSREATVYTGRCSDTGKHHPTHKNEWMCTHKHHKQHLNSRLPQLQSSIFEENDVHHPRSSDLLQLWTMFFPDPSYRMKAAEDPSTFWVCFSGQNNNCSSG